MSRNPAVEHVVRLLEPNPNLPQPLLEVSEAAAAFRDDMLDRLADGPELTGAVVSLLQGAARNLVNEIANNQCDDDDARRSAERALDRKCTAMNRLHEINEHLVSLGEAPIQSQARSADAAKMPLHRDEDAD